LLVVAAAVDGGNLRGESNLEGTKSTTRFEKEESLGHKFLLEMWWRW
jgi:hypothetical protein